MERIFTVHPKSDDDLEAAAIAQKIVDSPAFIEAHKRAMRLAGRYYAQKLLRGEPIVASELIALIEEACRQEHLADLPARTGPNYFSGFCCDFA